MVAGRAREDGIMRTLLLPLLLACLLPGACAQPQEATPHSSSTARPLRTTPLRTTPLRTTPLRARLEALREVGDGQPALEPRFSPDGSRLAFTGLRYQGLRVAPVDGGPTLTLSDEPAAGLKPAWSPDGKEIAHLALEADGSTVLEVRSTSGGEARQVHRAGSDEPRPFPHYVDGALAFLSRGQLRTATRALFEPLPDALLVAPANGSLLVAGETGVRLANQTLLEGRRIFDLAPGPDGRRALVRELPPDGGGALWSVDLATGQAVHLAGYDRGCLLPSGRIVAERLAGDGLQLTGGELWLMEADGSRAAKIEGIPVQVPYRVDCSPRGSLIAFGDDATDRVFVGRLEVAP